jgi:hypothetical protein
MQRKLRCDHCTGHFWRLVVTLHNGERLCGECYNRWLDQRVQEAQEAREREQHYSWPEPTSMTEGLEQMDGAA